VDIWAEAILAIVAIIAWLIYSMVPKNVLKWIASLATISLMVIVVIIDPFPTIVAKFCVFLSFVYVIFTNSKRSITAEVIAIAIITSFAIAYAVKSYEANFKPADDLVILSEENIEIQCINDKITVTETNGTYNYIEKLDNGGVRFGSIPYYRAEVINIEDITKSYIKLRVVKYTVMDNNCDPPDIYEIRQENRYELYVPEWSIYVDE
jgi:hypothetical protein